MAAKLPTRTVKGGPAPAPRKAAWDKALVRDFLAGKLTLAELEGVDRGALNRLAQMGHRYLDSGKLEKARRVFMGLVALAPQEAWLHTAVGCVAIREKNWPDAERWLGQALELKPGDPVASAHRGEVRLMLGRVREGLQDLVTAVAQDKTGQHPTTARARALVNELGARAKAAVKR